MRQTINTGKSSYHPNTTGGGCPFQAKAAEGGFVSYNERVDARKVRARSQSFFDHFSQATLFFNSQSDVEKNHIVDALRFELGKVEKVAIRVRIIGMLTQIDASLAERVAKGLGIIVPKEPEKPMNMSIPADGIPAMFEPTKVTSSLKSSEALSMANTVKNTIKTRQVAILAADGVNEDSLIAMKKALEDAGATAKVIAPHLGFITAAKEGLVKVDCSFLTAASVLFDAVYVPDGQASASTLQQQSDAIDFINEAHKHCKAIAANGTGAKFLAKTDIFTKNVTADKTPETMATMGVLMNQTPEDFINAIAQHRFWEREKLGKTA